MKPRHPTWFTLTPARNADGKPVVLLDFGKLGNITLDADDVGRMIEHLQNTIRAARDLGET